MEKIHTKSRLIFNGARLHLVIKAYPNCVSFVQTSLAF